MGHLVEAHRRFEATPTEWLPFGVQFSDLANTYADRKDIITFLGRGATGGMAVACFVPALGEMEIDVNAAFGEGFDPEFLPSFLDRRTFFDYPEIIGAIIHEAMHARHTHWLLTVKEKHPDLTVKLFRLVEWFEESRIEKRAVAHFPRDRAFLRTMALKFSLKEVVEIPAEELAAQGALGISKIMLLSLARVDAGVLEPHDVQKLQTLCEGYFGDELLTDLRLLWREAQRWGKDDDASGLIDIAERWVKLLEDAGHATEPEKLTPEEMEALAKFLGEMMDAFEGAAEEAEQEGSQEAVDQLVLEIREKENKEREEKEKEDQDFKDAADRVYSRNSGPPQGRTHSRLIKQREPEPEEVAAAITIAEQLQEAQFRERRREHRRMVLPPGKLNGRAAMQRDVEMRRGQISMAEPWRRTILHPADTPKLKLVVLGDISSSMTPAMEAIGVSTWLLSETGRHIGAEVTVLYYGNAVFSVLDPGEYQDEVNIYSAADGTEEFDRAFRAANGKVDLLGSDGARLLVVVSDMHYRTEIRQSVTKWFKRCDQAGVATMAFPITTRSVVDQLTAGTRCRVVMGTNPVEFATQIGTAASEALREAGSR